MYIESCQLSHGNNNSETTNSYLLVRSNITGCVLSNPFLSHPIDRYYSLYFHSSELIQSDKTVQNVYGTLGVPFVKGSVVGKDFDSYDDTDYSEENVREIDSVSYRKYREEVSL